MLGVSYFFFLLLQLQLLFLFSFHDAWIFFELVGSTSLVFSSSSSFWWTCFFFMLRLCGWGFALHLNLCIKYRILCVVLFIWFRKSFFFFRSYLFEFVSWPYSDFFLCWCSIIFNEYYYYSCWWWCWTAAQHTLIVKKFEFGHLKYGKIAFVSLRNFIFLSFFIFNFPLFHRPLSEFKFKWNAKFTQVCALGFFRCCCCSAADKYGKKEEEISGFWLNRKKTKKNWMFRNKKNLTQSSTCRWILCMCKFFFVGHSLTTLGDFIFWQNTILWTIRIKWSQLMIT